MNPQQLWQAALGELELLLSKANFTTWFKNTAISNFENEKIVVSVPNGFTKEWLEKKYHATILKALKSVTNNQVKEVTYKIEPIKEGGFVISASGTTPTEEVKIAVAENPKTQEGAATIVKTAYKNGELGLNPKYTFTTFIVGKNNELAHAAALAIAKTPGHAYNPLFIYGGVGLGKTHLMQAVGHEIQKANPNAKILYVSCEKFTNDFVSTVQKGKEAMEEFNKKYRSVDVLLMDDVQFLSNKEMTQEAFFHTFNELHQQNKQVVLTSDRPPKAIATLEHRLVSRFEWGMIADVSSPDLETKMAIIKTKAKEKNYKIADEIVNYLATVVHNNIRELEGALNSIIAHSQLRNRDLELEEVKQITSSITTNSQKKPLTCLLYTSDAADE